MTRHTPEEVIPKLRQAEADLAQGLGIAQVCQRLGVSEQTLHRWRNQYGGMKADDAKRLKELEARTPASSASLPSWPWTSRCSRRSPKKSGERRPAPAGRAPAPGDVRRLRAQRRPRAGAAALHAEAAAPKSHGARGASGGADAGTGAAPAALRLPA